MTNKEFFNILDELITKTPIDLSEDFHNKYLEIKDANISKAKEITEKGIKVLAFMAQNEKIYNNTFTAAVVAKELETTSRSISGTMKKLIDDGFCSKTKGNPVCYHIEDKGRGFEKL